MNKINKLLYGGFAIVIVAGIVAMLVSVFSPPKKTAEEETIEPPQTEPAPTETTSAEDEITPPEGYVGYWVNDEGNKVWLTQEELDKGVTAAEEQRRKEAAEKAEKEWRASRQDWIDRFPFEPTHHPEIAYDPEAYDPSRIREWPEAEKDDAYWKMKKMVDNHGFLRNFYESRLPYTEEFEQMHDIIHEELGEKANDTVLQGMLFERLKRYHWAKTKDPEEIRWKNVKRTIQPPKPKLLSSMLEDLTPEQFAVYRALPGEVRRGMTRKLRHSRDQEMRRRIEAYHNADTTKIVDVTWGEEAEGLKKSIFSELVWPHFFDPEWDESWIPEEQAIALVDRLVNEIPEEGFLEMEGGDLIYYGKYEKELKPGDPLLIK